MRLKQVTLVRFKRLVPVYQLEDSQLWDWNLRLRGRSERYTDQLSIRRFSIMRLKRRRSFRLPCFLTLYQLEDSQLWDWNYSISPIVIMPFSYYQLEDAQLWDWNFAQSAYTFTGQWLSIRRFSIMRLKRRAIAIIQGFIGNYQLEDSQLWDWNTFTRIQMDMSNNYQLEDSQLWDWNTKPLPLLCGFAASIN